MLTWEFIASAIEPHLIPGLLAAAIFTLGAIVIYLLPTYKWLAATILLIIITPVALPGFWFSMGHLGVSDWDQYFSYYHGLRRTMVEFKQFPLWSPWLCGGAATVGDPEFPVFSPTFLSIIAFGVENGLKITIYLATTVGALGMLMLGKRLKFSVYAALIAALGVTFSSVNLLEVVEGHVNIFAAMYLPWIFWSWLAAYRTQKKWWPAICGVFLALMFFQGGVYLLSYTTLAFLVLIILAPARQRAFVVTVKAGLWALGLAAIKLLPTILWLSQFPDKAYATSTYTLPYLHKILFGRYLHGAGGAAGLIPNQGSGWHEYGAYIGPFLAALAAVGTTQLRRSRAVWALCLAAVLALALSSTGPLLKPIFDQLPFIPRSNISRIILFAVMSLSLLAGVGLDVLRRQTRRTWLTAAVVIAALAYVSGDLLTLASQLSHQAFVLPYPEIPIPPAAPPIAHITYTYTIRHQEVDYTRAYAAVVQGYGTTAHCTVLGPGTQTRVRTIHDKQNFAPVLENDFLKVLDVSFWSPNRVITRVRAAQASEVHINTNYAKGWWVRIAGDPIPKPAKNIGERAGIILSPGEYTLTFYYHPPGLWAGISITIGTILLALGLGFYTPYRARKARSRP